MFGQNEIVGKKFYKDEVGKEVLNVTSMFLTLQGEGPLSGYPSFFIRLAKCNLNCSFCDTFFDSGDIFTFDRLEAEIKDRISAYWTDRDMAVPAWATREHNYEGVCLIITGGEPLLQDNLGPFLDRLKNQFRAIQIESNGLLHTYIPESVILVCSPKCAQKDGVSTKYLEPSQTILNRADCLKFVMSADQSSPYSSLPDWAFDWQRDNRSKTIYVSPMNIYLQMPRKAKELRALHQGEISIMERSTIDEVVSFWEPGLFDMKQNQLNHEYTARYCLDHNLRLNLQVHLFASLA